ncbi:hypothetical protein [Buttiauxella gaviniae]|uniref:hypothetical protein n=1 Tax=Buttiauxella gaviniae TaxID=82990 RepID=UPI003C725395
MKENDNIFLEDYTGDIGSIEFDLSKERFALAKLILTSLFWLTIFIVILRILPENIENDNVKELFNTIFQSIVPISSLVIGYYFGSKDK